MENPRIEAEIVNPEKECQVDLSGTVVDLIYMVEITIESISESFPIFEPKDILLIMQMYFDREEQNDS